MTANIHTHTPQNILPPKLESPKNQVEISKDIKPATSNYTLHALTHQAQTLNHTNTAQLTYNSPNHKKIISTTTLSYLYNQLAAQPNFTETKSRRKTCLQFQLTYQSATTKAPKKFQTPNTNPNPHTGGNNLATTQTLVSAVMLGNSKIRHNIPLVACCNSNLAKFLQELQICEQESEDRQTDRNKMFKPKGSTSARKPKPNLLSLLLESYDLYSQLSDMDKRESLGAFIPFFSCKVGAQLVGLCIG